MVQKKTWDDFRKTGLLLIINQLLHCFGWAIVVHIDKDGKVTNCFPARVKFRGFSHENSGPEYEKLADYLAENAIELRDEIKEPPVLKSAEMLISNVPTFVDYTKSFNKITIICVVFGGRALDIWSDIEEEILTKIKNQENENKS